MLELHTPSQAASWLRSRVTGTLHSDSRELRAGDGFIAWPGAASDARQYVAQALVRGASACLVEKTGVAAYGFGDPRVAAYEQLKGASGDIAAAYFDQPSQQIKLLAVTGTNGKTSTVWWLAQALSTLKQVAPVPCAMVGTLGIGRPPVVQTTGLTTPDPVLLQKALREFVDTGVQACAIEASSIGLVEQRLQGCRVHSAVFTNFTQDHLDYHGSMRAYWQAKMQLFSWPGLRSAIVNVDDPKGLELLDVLGRTALDIWTVSCSSPARLQACDISCETRGLRFTVCERGGEGVVSKAESQVLQTGLIGLYNVSNLLGVLAAMRSIGVPLAAAVEACADLAPVPGRMEFAGAQGQTLVAVDYAHTPDALGQALRALRPVSAQRGGKLWCVFGCGGDRDAGKRPLMGAVAASHADQVLVTSDNPRGEKPETIISQILLGLSGHRHVAVEPDRARAIALVLAQAAPADVVLLAGKGHEDYQEVAGQRLAFSDLDHVRRLQSLPLAQRVTEEELHG